MSLHTDYEKMPGHWLLAQLGKTVLRPGGIELTKDMLTQLHITANDHVVEFAPGLGVTAKLTLQQNPTYTAIEQNEEAAKQVRTYLQAPKEQCLIGTAENINLPSNSATIVYGEAMLTMQSAKQKTTIIQEAHRILQPGGLYGIHEMSLTTKTIEDNVADVIRKDLIDAIRVNATPLLADEWQNILIAQGFEILYVKQVPMHLLQPKRLVQDEGMFGVMKIAKNVIINPKARKRVIKMKNTFTKYEPYLQGICIVARRL
ncbi:methyltransferase [Lysinibacillus alkalisoli]|uniref:Methyltransferase n=1 Tax=Lysinibacillus alkalisoli TaxID=1911548 RepID=A0A917G6B9_9BACI|nr:methyltransferase [Lysinibacillus alkalisoli]